MITIEEFMTSRPYTLRENSSLNDAREIMTERNIRHIPITDEKKQLLGLVSQRDILAATNPISRQQTKSTPQGGYKHIMLSDIMTKDIRVIQKTSSLRDAAIYLQSHKYGCLPVLSDDSLVGIITDSDFMDIAINLLEQVEVAEEEMVLDTEDSFDDADLAE